MRFFNLFLLFFGFQTFIYGQLDPYVECMDEGDAVIGLDRKDWAPISDLSEGYKLDFEIPDTPYDCARISNVQFTLSYSEDMNTIDPPECLLFLYTNIYVDCPSNAPASCSGYWERQGSFPTILLENDNDDFQEGTLLGYDIIVVHDGNIAACDQTPIANGDYSASLEVCMEVYYELIGPEIDLGDDLEICETGTTTIFGPDDFDDYDWSGPVRSSEQDLEGAIPGFYELIVTDDNGCTGSDDVTVFPIDDFTLEINQPDTLTVCDLTSLPDLSAIVNGGMNAQGFDYLWTFPDASVSDRPTIAPDLDGTYTLFVEDRFSGCTNEAQIVIEFGQVAAAQIDSVSMESIALCGGDVTLEAFVPYTDTGDYTYEWVNGTDTTYGEFYTVSDEGMYILNLLNDRNCPVTSDTIQIIQSTLGFAGEDNSDEICESIVIDLNDYLINADSNGQWRDRDGSGALSNSMFDPIGLDGRYLFEYIIVNNMPCNNDTSVITMDIFREPSQAINDALCQDDFLIINGNRYDVNNPTGTENVSGNSPCDTLVNISLTFLDTYDVDRNEQLCDDQSTIINGTTYDINNPSGIENMIASNGCDSIVTVDLSFVSSINTMRDDELCQGQSIMVNGNTYDQGNPMGTETLQSINGCDSIINIDLSFISSVSFTVDDQLCEGQSVIVNGNTYDRNTPTGTEMLQSINGCDSLVTIDLSFVSNFNTTVDDELCSGESVVINGNTYNEANPSGIEMLQSINGCDSTINIALSFVSGFDEMRDDQLCPGESVIINGNTYNEVNPIGTENLQSISGCDSIINVMLSFFPTNSPTQNIESICEGDSVFVVDEYYMTAGMYSDIIPDQNGCDSLIETQVIVSPCAIDLEVDFIDLLCNGDNSGIIEFSITTMDNDTYAFAVVGDNGFNENGLISNGSVIEYTNLNAGMYQIIIIDGNNEEVASETFNLLEPDVVNVEINIESPIACHDDLADLSSTVTGGTGTFDYLWSSGETSENIIGIPAGTYTLSVTDQNNCTDEASVTLTEPDEFVLSVRSSNIPCGETDSGEIEIQQVFGGTEPYSYSIGGSTFTAETMYTGLSAGTYDIVVTDDNGCSIQTSVTIIVESSQSIAPIGPFTINEGESINLDLNLTFTPNSIAWMPAESLSCADCENPTANPTVTTTYDVMVEDDMGCIIPTQVQVIVNPFVESDPEIYLPTIFSPFEQGSNNNLFLPFTSSDTELMVDDFSIFDRWGNLVHQESGVVQGWDGTFNDKELGVGVYVYRISYTINGVAQNRAGSITLVK